MPHRKLQRWTSQKRIILEELQKAAAHPTAVELYETVRRRIPKISLGTVYRNLDLLAEQGTIHKLALGGKEARFDGNLERHYHVRCVRCNRMDDLHDLAADLVETEPNEVGGYEILGHRLEFFGICPDCGRNDVKDDSERKEDNKGE